jgi:hypothetical protein
MGNTDSLGYITLSTFRFLSKKKKLHKTEATILKFIRTQLPKVNNDKELINAFRGLRSELMVFIKDPYEKAFFKQFDFIAWLNSKIGDGHFVRSADGRKNDERSDTQPNT